MHNPLNQIVSSVFGESRLEDVSLDALHLLTVKYPYSAPVHLMYARRLKDSGDSRYAEAVSIAAIHYANPHWLQHQMAASFDAEAYRTNTPADSTVLLEETEAENREMEALPPDDTGSGHNMADADTDAVTEDFDTSSGTISPETDTLKSEIDSETYAPDSSFDPDETAYPSTPSMDPDASTEASYSPFEAGVETAGSEPSSGSEAVLDMTEPSDHADAASVAPEPPTEEPPFASPPAETPSDDEKAFDNAEDPPVSQEGGIEREEASEGQPSSVFDTGITTLYEGETTEASREVGDSELIHVTMPDTGTDDTPDGPAIGGLSEELGASSDGLPPSSGEDLPLLHETVEAPSFIEESSEETPVEGGSIPILDEPLLPVEPLHLSDYLASQGIVVSSDLEPKEDDKGERSFTGWLRTMKRFQPDRSAPVLSEQEEDVIRSEAEASNQDEDIVTEAMAEVYARQGLTRKAIEIYTKLSLLDPDRTSTFADRITQLKALLT
ncbi:MAG: hypothetical protein EBZ67_06590 [Chitinophagia bacterium]|nr:hypothetical protein [Chitinophagia bacterium]